MLGRILAGTDVLEKSLDAALLRNEAISQNIANVDTPGYKRKTVAFEEYLNDARAKIKGIRTRPEHIPVGARDVMDIDIKVSEDRSSLSMRLDENNVDIEEEMAQMAKNTIKYYLLTQKISGDFNKIKSVIKEGR
ncbi:flagellar basal-body rod protein FlgB [Acetivibrio thermocellus AD2]|jgi:flagellar basal-body rod protein FlgB|uniref:Flagellar basal body rod protein FlgB n=1 Tax=Acetivibrio thermocellus AD2 TaxID=1138384 RepID=A0AB36THP3_ACETH|nr:flagellar basal body rod protein FlgB [Acetivibrio thermocellus]CDG35176.1 flagellar basal-body rod protein FlgB [Acetivibrio thermocellus BC1]ADU74815.1 flagellar basal-body rod protein FlgB [Acetivibrio thermocellus DSM 1313]ALX08768.1 flagellar basal-body rod protein FlgB [Acetivibrio thermocellus AD2]ANV76519.1 flagellar basal-body rod protein FlgB [Acetivibrio thermocellus DSM 2360]EIC05276.1 flagellar basal-body rod protein FlgB [Acetivibrio thermocellus YS]